MDIPVLIACQRHSKKDRLTASPSCQSKNWPREKTSAPKWSEHAKYLHQAWSPFAVQCAPPKRRYWWWWCRRPQKCRSLRPHLPLALQLKTFTSTEAVYENLLQKFLDSWTGLSKNLGVCVSWFFLPIKSRNMRSVALTHWDGVQNSRSQGLYAIRDLELKSGFFIFVTKRVP